MITRHDHVNQVIVALHCGTEMGNKIYTKSRRCQGPRQILLRLTDDQVLVIE